MGAIKPGSQGERAISVKTIAQGRPGRLGQTCGDCRLHFFSAGGPRARPAPGLPCALCFQGRTLQASTRVKHAARTRSRVQASVSNQNCAKAGCACTATPPMQRMMTVLPKCLLASSITFASCWTTSSRGQREAKMRSDRFQDTSRNVATFGTSRNVATFAMAGVASTSCRYLSASLSVRDRCSRHSVDN
jgi:hypothetical protein